MATGSLRPPKQVITADTYKIIAEYINTNLKELFYARGNVGGVCVIVLKGDVYRAAENLRQIHGLPGTFVCYPDNENRMVHMK